MFKLKSTSETVVMLHQSTSPSDRPPVGYADILIPCYRKNGCYGRVQRVRLDSLKSTREQ